MKQYIILIVAIVFILLFNFWQCSYLENTSKYLLADIIDIKNSVDREDYVSAESSAKALSDTWNTVKPGWDIFGEHDDVEDIEEMVASIEVYSKYEEKIELINAYNVLIHKIENVVENEKFRLENIF